MFFNAALRLPCLALAKRPIARLEPPRTQLNSPSSLAAERHANSRSAPRSCSGCAPHSRARRAPPFNPSSSEPFNAPADSQCHASISQGDAPSCADTPKLLCTLQADLSTTFLRTPSIEARAAHVGCHYTTSATLNAQPNAGVKPRRGQPSITPAPFKSIAIQ